MELVCVVPNIWGSSGDAINERQLIETLSLHAKKTIIFTFVHITKIKAFRSDIVNSNFSSNKIIVIGIPELFPSIYNAFNRIIISFIIAIVLWLKSLINKEKKLMIYVRSSYLALGFASLLPSKLVVKIGALLEDEILGSSFIRLVISKAANLSDKIILSRAKVIAMPSPLLYRELLKRRRIIPAGYVRLVPAGIALNKIVTYRRTIDANEFKKTDIIRICFLGTLTWWQGVDILVKAVAILKNKFPELQDKIKLEIIGDGPQRFLIEGLCKVLRVNCEITGYLPHDEALERLSSCTVLALPSRRITTTESNFPIKILEAWAIGIPVVVTRHKIFEYYGLKDDQDLVYCEPTPASVTDALKKLLVSEELRNKLSQKGPEIASLFDYRTMVRELLKVINCQQSLKC
jgi:glycosyltransferase involved in cell wall biosynthesis